MKDQPETPWLNATEKARPFAPEYDTALTYYDLNPQDWTHMLPCRFGAARRCSWSETTRWSGDCYRYDIYQRDLGLRMGVKYAIRWENGSGCGWLICDNRVARDEYSIIDMIAALPEPRRWDACHFLWASAYKTELASKRREFEIVSKAFVEKRLKKKKIRGRNEYRVEIAPAVQTLTSVAA